MNSTEPDLHSVPEPKHQLDPHLDNSTLPPMATNPGEVPLLSPTGPSKGAAAANTAAATPESPTKTSIHNVPNNNPSPSTAAVVNVGNAGYEPIKERGNLQSFQIRALARKTVSYQKRQVMVNVCCVTLCPLMMVALSAILGIVLTNLINTTLSANEYQYCSKTPAMNDSTNTALTADFPTVPGSTIPGATLDMVKVTNFITIPSDISTSGPPVPGGTASCSMWVNKSYNFSDPYQRNPFANMTPPFSSIFANASLQAFARMDSTFRPDPKYGWLNPLSLSLPPALVPILNSQQYPWAIVLQPPGVDLGWKNQTDLVTGFNMPTSEPGKAGFLGRYPSKLFAVISSTNASSETLDFNVSGFQSVPYFEKIALNNTFSAESVDDYIGNIIKDTLDKLSGVNKRVLLQTDPPVTLRLKFLYEVANITAKVPWGAILYNVFKQDLQEFDYTLQFGSDRRISRAASFPAQGLRRFLMSAMTHNAILQESQPTFSITQGLRVMPSLVSTKLNLPIGSFIGRILYPFGVSFLLPIFVITLVREKESRILVMMQANGLRPITYFAAHFCHFLVLHVVSATVFIVSGVIFSLEFFTRTNAGVYILLFFLWGLVQISLSFFLSSFFSKSRNALVISYLIVLLSVIVNLATDTLITDKAPAAYLIWPPFAFYRGLSIVNRASFSKTKVPYAPYMLTGDDEVLATIIAMVIEFFVYLGLAAYLYQVLPSQYGVQKPWHFIFTEPYKSLTGENRRQEEKDKENYVIAVNEEETASEDADVKAERARIDQSRFEKDSPLVIRHMRKIYPGSKKIAVKDVTFAVKKDTVFGLLGPNGAGKTSLVSILTGIYPPTLGEAFIGGYNITTHREEVFRITGICPQHDILWDDLTCGEHVLFYARLKGIPPDQEEEAKNRALEAVSLRSFENRLSKGLSGGEKRRLSIAIALIGDPAVVFLDEPTTGLDPEVRRLVWDIILKARKGKTIVLISHSMEEVEVLCQRIAIMAKGTLRCIGSQLRLKQLYGAGFKLTFLTKPEHMKNAKAEVMNILPEGAQVVDEFATSSTIEFVPKPGSISHIFDQMRLNAPKWYIDDWGISQTSLEEVFLRLISETDAEGTAQ